MLFYYLLIGLIQGLTEFLPVSSSGHILLAGKIFNIQSDMLLLSVIVHLGTLLSVLIVYRKKVWQMIRHPFQPFNLKILLSTLITVVAVVFLSDAIESSFDGQFLIYGFLLTAMVLILCDVKKPSYKDVSYKTATFMGLAQCVALFPAISRSGMTIAAGIWSGADRSQVTEFTFLMSIPVILGSGLLEATKITSLPSNEILPLLIAFLGAFLAGLVAIKLMIKLVKKAKLYYFALYLLVLSVVLMFVKL